jgi:hypothetical protein
MRVISTGGTLAAPVTAERSDERSKSFSRGCASIVRNSVGGPGRKLMRSAWMRASTASASKTCCG